MLPTQEHQPQTSYEEPGDIEDSGSYNTQLESQAQGKAIRKRLVKYIRTTRKSKDGTVLVIKKVSYCISDIVPGINR